MMPDDGHPVRAVDKNDVWFPGFDLLAALFISPAQHLPATGRARFVASRVLSVDQMWWVRREKASQNFARFRHDVPPLRMWRDFPPLQEGLSRRKQSAIILGTQILQRFQPL